MNEAQYKRQLVSLLGEHFELLPEQVGTHVFTKEACIVDYLCRPRPSAIEKGFDDVWFVIECKSPVSKESVKKCLDGLAQTISYRFADFDGRRPMMGFLFPSISEFVKHDNENKYANSPSDQSSDRSVIYLRRLLQRLGIGEIVACPKRQYRFQFAASRFFDPVYGRSEVVGLGQTLQVGSRKK